MTEGKVVKKYRSGGITLTIWENSNEKNEVFNTFQLERSYKDKNDEWQVTNTFRMQDLPKIQEMTRKAYTDMLIKEDELKA